MVLVGDFGLATSSLAAVDPSDVASPSITMEADVTLGSFCFACFFRLGILIITLQRSEQGCISRPRYNREGEDEVLEIIQRRICTVLECVFSSPSPVIPTCFSYTGIRRLYSSR